VVVRNSVEKDLIVRENSRRSIIKGEAVQWYLQNNAEKAKKRVKIAAPYESLRNLHLLMEAVSPGPSNVELDKMLPLAITGGSDVPLETVKVEKDGKTTQLEVVHRDKIKELSKLVKYCKDPWNSSLQQQLIKVQLEMESAEYEPDEAVRAAVVDLAIIGQKECLTGRMGSLFNGRNVRLAWCNVMNSFLRKDQFMFAMCLRVLLYHLESGN
jgi:hypothetical protein